MTHVPRKTHGRGSRRESTPARQLDALQPTWTSFFRPANELRRADSSGHKGRAAAVGTSRDLRRSQAARVLRTVAVDRNCSQLEGTVPNVAYTRRSLASTSDSPAVQASRIA